MNDKQTLLSELHQARLDRLKEICAEHGISRNEDNDLIWYLWEKWRTKEDYENYISTPPRSKTSKFMEIVLECSNGEMKEIWIDLY